MPIQIKELNVKITLEEKPTSHSSPVLSNQKINEIKTEMIRSCTKKVIEFIKEREER